MTQVHTIHLPLWQLGLALVPFLFFILAAAGLRRLLHSQPESGEEPDWSVPKLAGSSEKSPFHRWDVRCKILSLLVYAFLIASLRHLQPALIAVGVSVFALILARTPLSRAAFRFLAVSGFLSMLLLVMPFSAPAHAGDTVLIFGGLDVLGFNLRGLAVAGSIAAKGVAIALLSEPLLNTASLPVTLQGLTRLGVPRMFGQMVLISHRYLHVFRDEARRMAAGMQVRGFRNGSQMATFKAVANFLGMLFVRSFERTERVFDAMQARGYQGRFPETAEMHICAWDVLFGLAWVLFGAALLAFDLFWM
jgi:cobalt/nickel transport system permease protein